MSPTYTHINDLAKEAQPPANGILSRTLYKDDRLKVEIFGFAEGEELSEHTVDARHPAIPPGQARITLRDDTFDAKPGTWVHMPTGLRYST